MVVYDLQMLETCLWTKAIAVMVMALQSTILACPAAEEQTESETRVLLDSVVSVGYVVGTYGYIFLIVSCTVIMVYLAFVQ